MVSRWFNSILGQQKKHSLRLDHMGKGGTQVTPTNPYAESLGIAYSIPLTPRNEPPDSSLCAQGILLTNKIFKRLNL
jgi:hypothetical protein